MMEECTPRQSAKWVPHNTFASEMGMTEKVGHGGTASHVDEVNRTSNV